jgi:hypothetical protein
MRELIAIMDLPSIRPGDGNALDGFTLCVQSLVGLMHMQQYSFCPSPRPKLGSSQEPSAHINHSHSRGIVIHRTTKATALAEQGEQLLLGLRANDVTN